MYRYNPKSLLISAGAFALTLALLFGCSGGGDDGGGRVGESSPGASAGNRVPYNPIGVAYSALHASANPGEPSVDSDLDTIVGYTTPTGKSFSVVKTYYPQAQGFINLTEKIQNRKLGLLVGLFLFDPQRDWTAGNYNDFVKPYLGKVLGVLVGNETTNLGDMVAYTKQYIDLVRRDGPSTPVGTAQGTQFWMDDSRAKDLANMSDFIGANIYPEWDWHTADGNNQPVGKTPQAGFDSFVKQYQQLVDKYPGKQIVVTETGWPTTYGETRSPPPTQFPIGVSNAAEYFRLVAAWAEARQVAVFYYSMFDDWGAVDRSSAFNYHFGLLDTDRKSK